MLNKKELYFFFVERFEICMEFDIYKIMINPAQGDKEYQEYKLKSEINKAELYKKNKRKTKKKTGSPGKKNNKNQGQLLGKDANHNQLKEKTFTLQMNESDDEDDCFNS